MDPEPVDPDLEMPSYFPLGGDDWMFEPCLFGDVMLETRWTQTDGLYWNSEIGQGPDSWGI